MAKFNYMDWQKAESSEVRGENDLICKMLRAFSKLEVSGVVEGRPAAAPGEPQTLGILSDS